MEVKGNNTQPGNITDITLGQPVLPDSMYESDTLETAWKRIRWLESIVDRMDKRLILHERNKI